MPTLTAPKRYHGLSEMDSTCSEDREPEASASGPTIMLGFIKKRKPMLTWN